MSKIATRMLEMRGDGTGLDKHENRRASTGAFNVFRKQSESPTGIFTAEDKARAMSGMGRDMNFSVINYDGGITIQNVTQPLVIVDNPITSALMPVTFQDFYFGFKINPANHANNEITMQREFEKKLSVNINELLQMLNVRSIAALETAKTQVLADDLGGRYPLTGSVVVAPNTEKDSFLGDIDLLSVGNRFYDTNDVILNLSMRSHVNNNIGEKGMYNSENKSYQLDNKTFYLDNTLPNAVGHIATAYVVQNDSLGLLRQYSPDCLMNHTAGAYEWGISSLPGIDLPFGTYYYEGAENGQALTGAASAHLTATKVQAYGFHIRLGWGSTYNSDRATIASPIMKAAIAAPV